MNISTVLILSTAPAPVAETLDSIFGQTFPPSEVLVISDGASDETNGIRRRFPEVRWITQSIEGVNAARRHGLEQVAHSWVTLVEPGDLWQPEHLERLVPVLRENPDAPGAVAGAVRFDDRPPSFSPWGKDVQPLDPWAEFPLPVIATSSQVLFNRDVLQQAGGWPTRFPGVAEFHAWLTLTARRPFLRIPGETVGWWSPEAASPLLRRRNRWEHCDRYLSAAQDRVNLRLRYHPSEAAAIKARLRLARHLLAWRFADAMLGPSQSAPLAIQADKLLVDEPLETQRRLLAQAFYFFPIHDHSTRLGKAVRLVQLWRRCPSEALHLRRALRRYLGERVGGSLPIASG